MKKTTSITIDEKLLNWLNGQVETKRFASRSHAVEYLIHQLMESEKK